MTQQTFITRTQNAHAFDVATALADECDARNVANNDANTMRAILRDIIARTLTAPVRNDDDDDARAFASFLTRHDAAPEQPARYRARIVLFARNVRHARRHGVVLNANKYVNRAFVIVANDAHDADDASSHAFNVIGSHHDV